MNILFIGDIMGRCGRDAVFELLPEIKHEYNIDISSESFENLKGRYDAVILGVAHNEFVGKDIRDLLKDKSVGVVYDVKGILDRDQIDGRL